ncbi:MAG TPA: hypothetical protein VFS84_16260 [Candidatus Binatia bacterium]|nr:hypothetical protein [Candidatus Binatia bacterium]
MGLVEVECTGVAPRGRTDLAEDDKADVLMIACQPRTIPTCRSGQKEKPTLESRLSMTAMFTRMNTGYLQRLDLLFAEEKAIFKVRLYDHCVRRSAGRARKMRAVLGVGA